MLATRPRVYISKLATSAATACFLTISLRGIGQPSVLGPAWDPTAPWGTTFSKKRAWPYCVVFLSNYLFRALRLHNFHSL